MKYLAYIAFLLVISFGYGQEDAQKTVIQFTGVIFASDSTSIIPGTHIYIPKNGRGTTANPYGFFSMPVLEGDSVVFSAIGYKKSHYIIPKHKGKVSLRVMVFLEEDITFLEEVEIRPYPNEAMFKDAIISMELPNQKEYVNVYKWLNSEYMKLGYAYLPASPNANAQYFLNQQSLAYRNKYAPPINNFANPFAWAQFINSLKRKK